MEPVSLEAGCSDPRRCGLSTWVQARKSFTLAQPCTLDVTASDPVGETGCAVSSRVPGATVNVGQKRTNIPIIEDARYPNKYRMLIGMVDRPSRMWPNQTRPSLRSIRISSSRIGPVVISVKANCIDSTLPPSTCSHRKSTSCRAVQATGAADPRAIGDHAVVIARYRDAEE